MNENNGPSCFKVARLMTYVSNHLAEGLVALTIPKGGAGIVSDAAHTTGANDKKYMPIGIGG